jgi:outer membrane protein assembly factor BamA/autotransporter translocation and assembly factor TamB
MRRRAAIVVLGLGAAMAALALVVHTPFVRARVLRYALATVQEQYGITLQAERLDYNLAALRVGLAGIRIAAPGYAAEPFFQADYLSATLLRSALFGDVAFENVGVVNGAVLVVRRADGTTNLPPSSESPDGDPPPLRISLIDIPRLRIELRDEQGDAAFVAPSAAVRLTSEDGRIALLVPADVRAGDRRTRITQLDAQATFDGRALILTNAQLRSAEATARLDGTLTLIARDAAVDATVAGTADVAALARWAMTDADVPTGTVAFEGRISGPMGAPDTDIRLTSDRLAMRNLVLTDVAARTHMTTAEVRIDEFGFGFEGGRVMGKALVPFDAAIDASIDASWSGVDGTRLVRVVAPDAALVPSAAISGELTASGQVADSDRWRADIRARFAPGRNGRNRIAVAGDAHVALARLDWRLDGTDRIGGIVPMTFTARGRILQGRDTDTSVTGLVHIGNTPLLPLFDMMRTVGIADVPADVLSSGTLNGELQLRGRSSDLRIGFDAVADGVTVDQAGASGRVMAAGDYAVNSQRYTATVTATDWELMPSAERPLAGRLDLRFTGAGTVDQPAGEADLGVRGAVWDGTSLGDIGAHVTLDGGTALIDARAPQFAASASGRVAIDAPYVASIDLRSDQLNLAELPWLASLGPDVPPIRGTTTFSAHVDGPLESWRRGSATAEIASLEATAGELPIRLAEPARFGYADDRVRIERLEATAGETRLSASGELPILDGPIAEPPAAVLVTMTGDVGEIARAAAAAGVTELPLAGGRGPVALLARVTGSLEAPVIAADLEAGPGSVTVEGFAPVSDVRLRAHAESGVLELREANASYQGANVSATARAPLSLLTGEPASPTDGRIELHARATGITPRVLDAVLDPATLEEVAGTIDATADLASPTLNLDDVTGEIRLDRLEMRAADLPVTQGVPTRVSIRDGFARIEAWDWKGQGATLGLRGQVRLADQQLAILANGTLDLRMLTPFVRDAGMATAGTLAPRLSITGAATDPRVDGDLAMSGGEVRLADPRVLLSDLTGRAVLTRNSATITTLTGTMNGGPLTGEGVVNYDDDGLRAQLSAEVRGMALEFPPGLRSEVNAALALALAQPRGQEAPSGEITGTATVVRGFYREPLAVVTGLLASLRTRRLAAAAEPSPLLDALALDVRLLTDEDIIVDNNYGRFQVGGDLRVIGTASAPALSGRADLREGGQLFVGRNVYTISDGSRIDFANPVTIEPDLDVRAATRAGGEDIEVTIRGTPETIGVGLVSTSDPSLGQAEVASLLLTGRRYADLDPRDAAFVGTQVLGNFSAEVLGFAGRAVGLDTLRLGGVEGGAVRRDPTAVATEVDPTTRVTFGKSVGPDVDLTFSQSLRDSTAQTWIVDYVPARRVELRLVSDDRDLRSYGFRHDVTFGGGAPRPIQSGAESQRVGERRVAAVNISGDGVLPEDRVRDLLRLTAGRRFDFGEWQSDRDRIEALYRRSGHLTARVDANRTEEENTVTLVYSVMPGPKTSLTVTGLDVDAALRSRLERAWSDAGFDEFIADEATQILKTELAGEGYLQPTVSARVEGDAAAKTLVIAVERGQRITRTIIDVRRAGAAEGRPAATGAEGEPGDDLDAFLENRNLADRAVTDPGAVEREVTAYLRAIGHLRSKVTAGTPRFDEAMAIVPLTVDAGPVFTIATVTFDFGGGALESSPNGLPIDRVREVAAVVEGAPYDPAAPDAARDRLVALYRGEAFPTPAVTVVQTVREGMPLVDVAFVVTEGPRHVLGEAVVSGNRAIDADVIVRALALDVGEPLRAEESLRARTRVFDTGLFRRVDISSEPMEASLTGLAPQQESARSTPVTPMRLRVTVEEWPALRLRYGVQVAEERPEGSIEGRDLVPGLTADLTRRTLFGRAVGVGAAIDVQRREQRARGFLNAPTLAGWPIESSLVLDRSRETFAALTLVTSAQGMAWEQRARVARALSLSYSYRFERNHTFDTAPPRPEFPSFDITINIARLNTAVAWDTRDDPTDSMRGTFASSSIEYAPEVLGSDIRFVRFVSQAYAFRPWRGMVFASAARLGIASALDEQELIFSERFFAGGAGTVRGVAEDSLGGVDFFGDPTGGQASLVLNQEVRVPVYRWVRAVGFIDAGNVFPRWRDVRVGELVGSIGVGVRLATPFALLRADYARAIWTGTPAPSARFIVGIGHAF